MSKLLWYPGQDQLVPDMVRAENCSLYDARGNRYVDLESGVWCTSVGHGHPRVRRVLAERASRLAHTGFNYSAAVVEEAAGELLELLGLSEGRAVFLCSGSEAVEYGVRIAQSILDRPLMLTMRDAYFGAYGSAFRRAADEWFGFEWTACARCAREGACNERCEHWAAVPWDRIGGFLLEPGSSGGLVRFPPEKLIGGIVERIGRAGGLVIVNEVTTGVGRTGRWFGHQHYGLAPDIVAVGKGIGNGYPVSATVVGAKAMARLGGEPIAYAQSHQNDPLGAAVALEVMRVIRDEGLIERGRTIGARLQAGVTAVAARTGRIREVRTRGLMMAIELEDPAPSAFTVWAHRELVRRGFLLGRRVNTSVLRLDPALTIEEEDIARFLIVLEDVLNAPGV